MCFLKIGFAGNRFQVPSPELEEATTDRSTRNLPGVAPLRIRLSRAEKRLPPETTDKIVENLAIPVSLPDEVPDEAEPLTFD